jgi:trehalose-6-phosphate synthase
VWSINDRYGTARGSRCMYSRNHCPWSGSPCFYRAADVCVVNSLQDGMNLVAKEFIAAQVDDPGGVLVLSKFAGAAEELDGACEINPYDPEGAAGVRRALLMSGASAADRMQRLRGSLRTIYDWMGEIFDVWGAVARGETHRSPTPTAGGGRGDARQHSAAQARRGGTGPDGDPRLLRGVRRATSRNTRCRRS